MTRTPTLVKLGKDTSGRPLVLDDRTLSKIRHAERRLGFPLTIVQGSYRAGAGAKASAGTHDRGGVVDFRVWDIPTRVGIWRVLVALREAGLIAWLRTRAQGFDPHIHAIDYGNPWLSPDAAHQVTEYEAGRNGLRSRGRDDGPRVTIPKEEPEMTPDEIAAAPLVMLRGKANKPTKTTLQAVLRDLEGTQDKHGDRLAVIETKLDLLLEKG